MVRCCCFYRHRKCKYDKYYGRKYDYDDNDDNGDDDGYYCYHEITMRYTQDDSQI